jgi:hypothetical protein
MFYRFHLPVLLLVLLVSVSFRLYAQEAKTEKRVYLVDMTASMEGKGQTPTPNILSKVKNNLIDAISSIEDQDTEILIIPFTNKPHEQQAIAGTIRERESILSRINALRVLPGDTNIIAAWEYGITQLDRKKINYMFLLTDGRHNVGGTMDQLLDRLRAWEGLSGGKYLYYSFYVMLTKNARHEQIKEIASSTANMWVIENMNINASLIKTPIRQKVNVFNNNSATIAFTTNNKKADLSQLKLLFSLQENDYYSIKNIKKSPKGDSYSFEIAEKLPRLEMPFDTTLALSFVYDTKANPFIFFTPEKIDFQILNQGPRKVSVAIGDSGQPLDSLDLGLLTYKEPFQGFFRWTRRIYEKTLDWKILSWAIPDTASATTRMILSWNEEAIRSGSSVQFHLSDTLNPFADHIRVRNDLGDASFSAKAGPRDTVSFTVTVIPGIPSTSFSGSVISVPTKLNFVDGIKLQGNDPEAVGEWQLDYKKGFPFWLWVMWSLPFLLVFLLLLFFILRAVKRSRKIKMADLSIVTHTDNSNDERVPHEKEIVQDKSIRRDPPTNEDSDIF